jgi:tetratricopeptide (TPR) repeat protein
MWHGKCTLWSPTVTAMSSQNIKKSAAVYGVLIAFAVSGCRTSPEAKEANHLKRGEALIAKRDYARALLEFRNAANAMPKDAEPYYQMGLAYLATGDVNTAIRGFRQAVALKPTHSGAQLKLAELMTLSRNDKLVEEAITRVVEAFGATPNNPEALDTLAIAEWKRGKPEDAVQHLEEALKNPPTHLQSSITLARLKLSQNDRSGAEEVLKKAVADAPQSSAAAVALADIYLFMQQPEKAEAQLKRALQLDPKNGLALIALGSIQVAAKRIDEAEQTYKRLSALPEKAYKPVHAMFFYQFGKREAGIAELETLVKADPADREIRSRLVAAYFNMDRVTEAERVLASALKRNSKDTDALLQRAELRLRSGKTDDAEKDLNTVIHFNPDSADAHFILAKVYRTKGFGNNQQQELQRAVQLNPAMLSARLALAVKFLSAKTAQTALEIIDQAPEAQKSELQWILARNWALLSLGNLKEAKIGVDRALQQGRAPEAVFQNAVLRTLQRDYAGARTSLDELLKQGTTDPNVVDLLMQTYVAQQAPAKGMERLKELARAQAKSAALQHVLGQWYVRAGDLPDARKAFESAKSADPHFTSADLAIADLDLREGQSGPARQKLNGIVTADPKNLPALMLLARAENESGDHAAEIETYRTILSLDHSNPLALNNLAYQLAVKSPDEALKFAEQAAEVAPDNPGIQDTLGWIYYRKGLYSMAVRYLKTAVEKGPNPRRQFHLGMSYLKMGDQVAGQKMVREALQKDPKLADTEQGW